MAYNHDQDYSKSGVAYNYGKATVEVVRPTTTAKATVELVWPTTTAKATIEVMWLATTAKRNNSCSSLAYSSYVCSSTT